MIELINLDQGSNEWLEWRKINYKSASRTPIVMGISPFSKIEDLAKELKFGITKESNYAMRQGVEREDEVREYYCTMSDETYIPKVYKNGDYVASLDGINFDGDSILEIKVSDKTYNAIFENRDEDLRHYEWQIRHQMMVSGATEGMLCAMSPTNGKIIHKRYEYNPDDNQKIIDAWNEFDRFLGSYELPTELTVDDPHAIDMAKEYIRISGEIKELEEHQKKIKKELEDYATAEKNYIGNLTISRQKGRVSTDYEQMIKDLGIDSIDEKYKKQSKDSFVFRIYKG